MGFIRIAISGKENKEKYNEAEKRSTGWIRLHYLTGAIIPKLYSYLSTPFGGRIRLSVSLSEIRIHSMAKLNLVVGSMLGAAEYIAEPVANLLEQASHQTRIHTTRPSWQRCWMMRNPSCWWSPLPTAPVMFPTTCNPSTRILPSNIRILIH